MYAKGELSCLVTHEPCRLPCYEEDHNHDHAKDDGDLDPARAPSDSRGEYERIEPPACWLPHSCDAWVIGGVAEAEVLIADLRTFIDAAKIVSKA